MALNVTTAEIGSSCRRATAEPSLVQWDRGQILKITGVTLPGSYNVEFCCQGDAETTTMIGSADGVQVPNALLERGLSIIAYLVLHEGQDDRETEYWITINVKQRPQPPEVDPDPEQEGVIDQLIAALNAGVESAEGSATEAAASARDAEDAAEAAEAAAAQVATLDIVPAFADIAATKKDYVLVLDCYSDYCQGGPCLFKKSSTWTTYAYTRDDGSRVYPVPDQGELHASKPPADLLLPYIKSYMDNSSLVYGHSTLFADSVSNEIDCGAFVYAILQGVSYALSKYATGNTENTSVEVSKESWTGTKAPAGLSVDRLAKYFAEKRQLFSFDAAAPDKELRQLQFGDILFYTGEPESVKYYAIGHVAIVLGTAVIDDAGGYVVVAQCGGRSTPWIAALNKQLFGSEVGNIAVVNFNADNIAEHLQLFARPNYNEMLYDDKLETVKALLSGTYTISIANDFLPGLLIGSNYEISYNARFGITGKYYDAIPGATIIYTGERSDAVGNAYLSMLIEYDKDFKPLSRTSITASAAQSGVTLSASTRYIRFTFGYSTNAPSAPLTIHSAEAFAATMST